MNPLEYLILGFMVVMVIGTWVLIGAIRRAQDGFENEHGFQLGIAPPLQSVYALPGFSQAGPARAVVPEIITTKSPRRPQGSKPPMLPANLTVADLNPSTERKPRRRRKQADTNRQDTQPPFSGSVDTPKNL